MGENIFTIFSNIDVCCDEGEEEKGANFFFNEYKRCGWNGEKDNERERI